MCDHTKFLILSALWVLLFIGFGLVLPSCFLRLSLMNSQSSDWPENVVELLIRPPPPPEHWGCKCAITPGLCCIEGQAQDFMHARQAHSQLYILSTQCFLLYSTLF